MAPATKNPEGTIQIPQYLTVEYLIATYGAHKAFVACWRLGGFRTYIPKGKSKCNPVRGRQSPLRAIFTTDELLHLSELYGGDYIKLPLAHAFCIRMMFWVHGLSTNDIGRKMRMHEDTVRRHIGKRPPAYVTQTELASSDRARQQRLSPSAIRRQVFGQLGISETDDVRKTASVSR